MCVCGVCVCVVCVCVVCVCVWCAAQHQPEVTATSLKVKKLLKLFGQCHGIYDCSFLDDNAIHKLGMLRKMVASFHLWGSPLEPLLSCPDHISWYSFVKVMVFHNLYE